LFDKFRQQQYAAYLKAKTFFSENPNALIELEQFFSNRLKDLIAKNWAEIKRDYDEASYLYPFWQNYPPDERGRQPVGDQFPWIEVGEHAVGAKLPRFLAQEFAVRDSGLPTGSDQRFVLSSPEVKKITKGYTDSVWLFMDIKSVGPRDDFKHAVMSHNQVSGDGIWTDAAAGMKNTILTASGARTSHDFHCSMPPVYVLSDNIVAPTVNIAIKPVYDMLALKGKDKGQPLARITLIAIPNGILLATNPNYLKTYPGLLFPGKDDKDKNPLKVRARVSFALLSKIAAWRVVTVEGPVKKEEGAQAVKPPKVLEI
jgi:hypothetical protein